MSKSKFLNRWKPEEDKLAFSIIEKGSPDGVFSWTLAQKVAQEELEILRREHGRTASGVINHINRLRYRKRKPFRNGKRKQRNIVVNREPAREETTRPRHMEEAANFCPRCGCNLVAVNAAINLGE